MENLFFQKPLKLFKINVFLSVFLLLFTASALATTTGNLPFNTAMDTFKENFLAWICVAAIVLWVATCLMLAFGEFGEGMKRVLTITFWLSLALAGPTGIMLLFGTGAVF